MLRRQGAAPGRSPVTGARSRSRQGRQSGRSRGGSTPLREEALSVCYRTPATIMEAAEETVTHLGHPPVYPVRSVRDLPGCLEVTDLSQSPQGAQPDAWASLLREVVAQESARLDEQVGVGVGRIAVICPSPGRTEALLRQTYHLFSEYAEMAGGIAEEVLITVMDSRDPGFLADYIAQNVALRFTDKQEILEEISPFARLRKLNSFLARENNVLGFEHELEGKVRDQLVSSQREQILRTQIRVLQNELGETDDDDEVETYRQKIVALELDEDTEKHLLKEVNKLAKQPFGSAEGAVIRNYLDVCLEMPWKETTKERVSVEAARKVLEKTTTAWRRSRSGFWRPSPSGR